MKNELLFLAEDLLLYFTLSLLLFNQNFTQFCECFASDYMYLLYFVIPRNIYLTVFIVRHKSVMNNE